MFFKLVSTFIAVFIMCGFVLIPVVSTGFAVWQDHLRGKGFQRSSWLLLATFLVEGLTIVPVTGSPLGVHRFGWAATCWTFAPYFLLAMCFFQAVLLEDARRDSLEKHDYCGVMDAESWAPLLTGGFAFGILLLGLSVLFVYTISNPHTTTASLFSVQTTLGS